MNMKSILYWYMNVMNKCIEIDECIYEYECDEWMNEWMNEECMYWLINKLNKCIPEWKYIWIWTWCMR